MCKDEVHVKWAQRVAVVASIVMYASGVDIVSIILLYMLFMFGTKYVSPDLDTESIPYHRWGVLRELVYPFQLLKHHKRSHHIIIGPILVVSYFLIIALAGAVCINAFWLPVVEPLIEQGKEILHQLVTLNMTRDTMVLIGTGIVVLLLAAGVHIIIDRMFTNDREER